MIGRPEILGGVSDGTRDTWQRWQFAEVAAQDSALSDWLGKQGAAAVLLRPDRYIMGIAKSAQELDAITAGMPVVALQSH